MNQPRAAATLYHPEADRGTDPLDLTLAYLRRAGVDAGLLYLPAAAPVLAAGVWWIGVVTAGDRPALATASLALTAAWALRWALLTPLYARVMRDAGLPVRITPRALLTVVAGRTIAHPLTVWGGPLVRPGAWAWGFSSMVTPCVLTAQGPANTGVRQAGRLLGQHTRRLLRQSTYAGLLAVVGALGFTATLLILVTQLLPALTGHDFTTIKLAMRGPAWWLNTALLAVLTFDFVWVIASVFLAAELEARRTGRDLSLRLERLKARAR